MIRGESTVINLFFFFFYIFIYNPGLLNSHLLLHGSTINTIFIMYQSQHIYIAKSIWTQQNLTKILPKKKM